MKRIILILSLMAFLLFSLGALASDEWRISTSEDAMEGTVVYSTHSPRAEPKNEMGFPYSNTTATLSVGFDDGDEWVYMSFSNGPNLLNTTIKEGGYNVINTRIKWDDGEVEKAKLTQNWGSKIIHFSNYAAAISAIENSEKMLLELNWYGEGLVHFEFDLVGAAEKINEIRGSIK